MTNGKHHEGWGSDSGHERELSVRALSVVFTRQVLCSGLGTSKTGCGGVIRTCC